MAMGKELWQSVRRNRNAYLFISPFYIMFLCFMLFPIVFSFALSFQRWNGIMAPRFAGLANYRAILSDAGFLNALTNTAIFTLLTVSISLVISLALALFLNNVRIFKRFYRAIFFVPAIVSLVVVSLVWKLILNSDVGLIREVLDWVAAGITHLSGSAPGWLTHRFRLLDNPNPIIPLLTITLVNVWAVVGFNTVIYLAGLQGIPSYM
jgi:ABC-type sugar transport system permease subunit